MYHGERTPRKHRNIQRILNEHVVGPIQSSVNAIIDTTQRVRDSIARVHQDKIDGRKLAYQMEVGLPQFAYNAALIAGSFTSPDSPTVQHSTVRVDTIGVRINANGIAHIGFGPDIAFMHILAPDSSSHRIIYRRVPNEPGTYWYQYNDLEGQIPPSYIPEVQTIFLRDIDRIANSSALASLLDSNHHTRVVQSPRQHQPPRPGTIGNFFNGGHSIPVYPDSPVGQQLIPGLAKILRPVVDPHTPFPAVPARRLTATLPGGTADRLPVGSQYAPNLPYDEQPSPYDNIGKYKPWTMSAHSLLDEPIANRAMLHLIEREKEKRKTRPFAS